MKNLLLTILIAFNSFSLFAQIPHTVEATIVNNTETGLWWGANIPCDVPTRLIYRNNAI